MAQENEEAPTEEAPIELSAEQKLEIRTIQLKRQGLLTQLGELREQSEAVRKYVQTLNLLNQVMQEYSTKVDEVVLQYITEEDKSKYILDTDLNLKLKPQEEE